MSQESALRIIYTPQAVLIHSLYTMAFAFVARLGTKKYATLTDSNDDQNSTT
jgi:hypothetical protein